jgi:hypothetical protein
VCEPQGISQSSQGSPLCLLPDHENTTTEIRECLLNALWPDLNTCFLVSWGGVRLSPLCTPATNWPIVPAPDDRWVWSVWWNENWQGNPKYSEETCPSATSSTTNPTWLGLGSSLDLRGGKPVTNRPSQIKSKSHYDRRSVGQSVLVSSPIWDRRPDFLYCQTAAVLSMWGTLSEERTGLSFVVVIINSTWHLYLHVYLSAFYIDICQGSGSLWIHIIYSYLQYVCKIHTRPLSVCYATANFNT